MTDPFAEVVTLLQPSLPFSKTTSGGGFWQVEGRGAGEPMFCVILEGSMRAQIGDESELVLQENDFILIPAMHAFTMQATQAPDEASGDPLAVTTVAGETRHGDPEAPINMRAMLGRLAFGSPDAALLMVLLPKLIHVRGQKRLATLVQLIRGEAQDDRPARDMVIERLLEVLLIEALRAAADSVTAPGLLRGMGDARLAVALRRMHEDPDRDWTVEQLATAAALSRSVFFDRFRKVVGVTPMDYLLAWRMALAKSMLRRRDTGIKLIAERVGYGSASAFSVAFTRFVGMPPTQYARESPGAA